MTHDALDDQIWIPSQCFEQIRQVLQGYTVPVHTGVDLQVHADFLAGIADGVQTDGVGDDEREIKQFQIPEVSRIDHAHDQHRLIADFADAEGFIVAVDGDIVEQPVFQYLSHLFDAVTVGVGL